MSEDECADCEEALPRDKPAWEIEDFFDGGIFYICRECAKKRRDAGGPYGTPTDGTSTLDD